MSAARRRPRRWAVLLSITTGSLLLAAPPAPGQQGVSLEQPEQRQADPLPRALPPSRRVPVLAELDEDGMRNPPVADLQLRAGATPEEPFPGAMALPRKGGPNYDVFALPGAGEHVAVVSPDDVNVQDGQGRWVRAADRLEAVGEDWEGDLSPVRVRLPRRLGTSGVSLTLSEGTIETAPVGLVDDATGARQGDRIVYENAEPATDFRYHLVPGGYAEEVVLKGPRAPGVFAFELRVSAGMTVAPADEGGGFEVSSGGEVVAEIPAPVAYDSSPGIADSVPEAVLTRVAPGTYLLEVRLDPAFLREAIYPVVLDPVTRTRTPTRDAYVKRTSPGTSFEGAQYLKVDDNDFYSFLRFDISDLQETQGGDDKLVYAGEVAVWVVSQGAPNTLVKARSEPRRVHRRLDSLSPALPSWASFR